MQTYLQLAGSEEHAAAAGKLGRWKFKSFLKSMLVAQGDVKPAKAASEAVLEQLTASFAESVLARVVIKSALGIKTIMDLTTLVQRAAAAPGSTAALQGRTRPCCSALTFGS